MDENEPENGRKQVIAALISGGAIALCATLAMVSRVFAEDLLPIVYSCLILLVVVVGVLTAKDTFSDTGLGQSRGIFSAVSAASLLYCFISGEMYDPAALRLDGLNASTCFVIVAVVFALLLIMSLLIRFFKGDGDDDKEPMKAPPASCFGVDAQHNAVSSDAGIPSVFGNGPVESKQRSTVSEANAKTFSIRDSDGRGSGRDPLSTHFEKAMLVAGVIVLVACIAFCLSGIPVRGMDGSTFDGVFKSVVFGTILALAIMVAVVAVVFLATTVLRVFSVSMQIRNHGHPEEDGYYLGMSLVICALVGTALLIRFPDFGFEDLLAVFGGFDYLALPVAGTIAVVCFAVFVRIVAAILSLAFSRFGKMKKVASECVDDLLNLVGDVLKKIVNALRFIPDFIQLAIGGVEDKAAEEWLKKLDSERAGIGARQRAEQNDSGK